MTFPDAYPFLRRPQLPLSWKQVVAAGRIIWGDDGWEEQFRLRCNISVRTIYRWKKRNKVKGPPVVMLDAFLRLRHAKMTLPPQEGLAP